MEPGGQPITEQIFDQQKSDIKALLMKMHSLGVAHGDIARRNIMVDGDAIRLIDFDHSFLQEDVTDPTIWNQMVHSDLDACQ